VALQQQRLTPRSRLCILAVDNGSGDLPKIERSHGRCIELLRLETNRGFAGGNNAAFNWALQGGADFVFLINSDAVAAPDCIQQLLDVAAQQPKAGIWGPLILRESAPEIAESCGQTFSLWSGRHRELGRGATIQQVEPEPYAVDAVSGCALLLRRSVLEQVGGFDERFFLYFEDLDLCLRAREAGFGAWAVSSARVWHLGEASLGKNSEVKTYYSVRNHLLVFQRHGLAAVRWLLWPLIPGYHLAFVLWSRRLQTGRHLTAVLRGTMAWRRGNSG